MININVLIMSIRQLPDPVHSGQIFNTSVPTRIESLNNMRPLKSGTNEAKKVETVSLRFKAVPYATSPNDKWLEWELDI